MSKKSQTSDYKKPEIFYEGMSNAILSDDKTRVFFSLSLKEIRHVLELYTDKDLKVSFNLRAEYPEVARYKVIEEVKRD